MSTSSVLLSTYNGKKYIVEQLDSLKNQTRKIDKVIIKDDCSTDNTVEIINNYIKKYDLNNWLLIRNDKNLGWKKNFVSMLDYVNTDYFFFCDQDDIWFLEKVNRMMCILDGNEKIDVLVSEYYPFYENGREPKKNIRVSGSVTKLSQKNFLLNRYPGCVMCLRTQTMKPFYENYWLEAIPHDSFASLCALSRDTLFVYKEYTIQYRRHAETTTHPTVLNREERVKESEYYTTLVDLYIKMGNKNNNDVSDVREWVNNRKYALYNKKPWILIKNIKYLDLYWSFHTYCMDWICAMGLR